MKKTSLAMMLLASATALTAYADQGLAMKSGCLECHAVDHEVVGPSFKDITKKYAGDATAEAKLIARVKNGSSGVWDTTPMPPNPLVSDADVQTLVKWVLSLK